MKPLFLLLFLTLSACATSRAPSDTPQPPPTCLPLHTYTPAEEAALGAAVADLPFGSPLVSAMVDYGAMRAGDRACLAGTK